MKILPKTTSHSVPVRQNCLQPNFKSATKINAKNIEKLIAYTQSEPEVVNNLVKSFKEILENFKSDNVKFTIQHKDGVNINIRAFVDNIRDIVEVNKDRFSRKEARSAQRNLFHMLFMTRGVNIFEKNLNVLEPITKEEASNLVEKLARKMKRESEGSITAKLVRSQNNLFVRTMEWLDTHGPNPDYPPLF